MKRKGSAMHLKDSVESCLGMVDVSTIDLSISGMGHGFETCLFFPGGDSEVVAWYSNAGDAIRGHKGFSNPAVIRAITEVMDTRDSYLHQLVKTMQTLDNIVEGVTK